jgi:hypothetical protein
MEADLQKKVLSLTGRQMTTCRIIQMHIPLPKKHNSMENQLIYPGEASQVSYWTKRWGITAGELHEAILETGSLGVNEIRGYLLKKNCSFTFKGIIQFLRLQINQ